MVMHELKYLLAALPFAGIATSFFCLGVGSLIGVLFFPLFLILFSFGIETVMGSPRKANWSLVMAYWGLSVTGLSLLLFSYFAS